MNQYPNQGQDPNQPQGQYPGQGEHTQYQAPGYGGAPNYGGQQQGFQQPSQGGYPQQGGYQQQHYQQGAYQQPQYMQSPYQQSPYPQKPAIAWDYRNIIAGAGSLVAVIAFFLPFYSYSVLGYYNTGAGLGGKLWLDFIIALIALGIVAFFQFGDQLFKTSVNPTVQRALTSLKTQPRNWYFFLLGLGIFGIFFHFILDLGSIGYWGFGAWLFLLGLAAIVTGAVLYIRPPTPAPNPSPFQNPPPGGPIPPQQ